jgi:hypothetical protein
MNQLQLLLHRHHHAHLEPMFHLYYLEEDSLEECFQLHLDYYLGHRHHHLQNHLLIQHQIHHRHHHRLM